MGDTLERVTEETREPRASGLRAHRLPCLTLLDHPDPRRLGERLMLSRRPGDAGHSIARAEGLFAPADGSREPSPLGHAKVSRTPLRIWTQADGRVALEAAAKINVRVDGSSLHGTRVVAQESLERGLVVELGRHVAFVLHDAALGAGRAAHGLTGGSAAIEAVRAHVDRVADLAVPVLLLGETGVGKERVAQAIHAASGRSGPLVPVNVATLSESLGAAELFGHERGAFTGADAARVGLFVEADGGTLFLDEIAELAPAVQPMLLRTLETSEVRPIGGARTRAVDVRVLAATDADLAGATAAGVFRAPLYHRLNGYAIEVPPLRERRPDLPLLVIALLREALAETGESARLLGESTPRWIAPGLLARLAMLPWPGNVRQLRGALRQLVVANRGASTLLLDSSVERALDAETPTEAAEVELEEPAVLAALAAHAYSLSRAAKALGVSRARLYRFVEAHPEIRTGAELQPEEIERARAQHAGHVEAMAASLRVSARALRLRMTALGL